MTEQPIATSADLTSYQAGDASLMLAAAEAAVRNYCGWHIYPSRVDEVLTVNGSGLPVQPLPSLYVTAVSSVTETTVDTSGAATTVTLTEGTDFDWSQAGYLTRLPYGTNYAYAWTPKMRGVTATITHGYDTVPPDVQAVVLAVATRAQDSAQGGGIDIAGPFRYTPSKNADGSTGGVLLSDAEKAVLVRYRIPAQP